MKRFVFPLDRVLRFRRLELERVEAHLSELAFRAHRERATADERRAESLQSSQHLTARREIRGADFQITRHWLARLESERGKALAASEKLLQQHREAIAQLIEARRKTRLLETLRQRKLDAHDLSNARQLETQASEFYLAKRIREQQR
jgi:hypothetical protein